MWLVAIYMLITKQQWAFELLLFIGMPGGIHSLLTPELTHGDSLIHKADFFYLMEDWFWHRCMQFLFSKCGHVNYHGFFLFLNYNY